MKKTRILKIFLAVMLLALSLVLSGCYVTPDVETTQNLSGVGGFPTFVPATSVPTAPVVTSAPIDLPPASNAPTNAGMTVIQTPSATSNSWTVIGGISTVPVINETPATITMPPTAQPTATPAGSLKLGSTGDQVRQVQQKLKQLGFYKGSVDGDFGEATEKAVIAFQKQYKLTADGKVGSQTMAKLAAANATAKPQVTATPKKATAKPTAKPSYSENTYLKKGSTGKQVTQMQERLIQLGYLTGKATGNFDAATEAAVIAFQKRNCSYWDGIAGPATLSVLYSSSARRTSSAAGMIGTSLKEGSTGQEVRNLQSRLKSLGYYKGNVDGDFGSGTTDAVKAFQRNNGLTVDGKAGSATLDKLYSSSARALNPTATPKRTPTKKPTVTPYRTPTPLPTGTYVRVTVAPNGDYFTLRRGYYGTPVEELQEELQKQGYFTGAVDGYYGEGTENAVKAFQRSNGLSVDGAAGPATLRVLYEGIYPHGS